MTKYIFLMMCLLLTANSHDARPVSTVPAAEETTVAEDSSTPFQVLMDKSALQSGRETAVRVFISTDLEKWSYTAQAQYGKITEIGPDSFLYTRPGADKREDMITVSLTDEENGKMHRMVIPLSYRPDLPGNGLSSSAS